MTTGELELCPFCHSRADLGGYDFSWYVRCSDRDCWARVNGRLYEDAAVAIAAWNNRRASGTEAALRKALERIRDEPDTNECCGHFRPGNGPEDEPECCGSPTSSHEEIARAALSPHAKEESNAEGQ